MSHIGFLCPPYPGHLNPMAALAESLGRRGHRTSFLGMADLREAVPHQRVVTIGDHSHPPGTLARMRRHMASPRGLGLWPILRDMATMTTLLCREGPAAVRQHGIDALVVDQLEPAGGLLAEHLGLPFVSVANALPIDRDPAVPPPFTDWRYDPSLWGLQRNAGGYRVADAMMAPVGRVIARWAAAFNLPPRRRIDECMSRRAGIMQLVSGLDMPRTVERPGAQACGPLRQPEPVTDVDALLGDGRRPAVFASLGTLQGGRLGLFRTIASACERLNLHLVVAHGGALTESQAASLPGAPVVRAFVPQRAVLARCALAITNGGLNTVLDALAAAIPPVVVPIAFEQGAIGARLIHAGAGLAVPLRRANPARLADALAQALRDPSLRAGARRLAAEIAAAGGVERAADIVESVLDIPAQASRDRRAGQSA